MRVTAVNLYRIICSGRYACRLSITLEVVTAARYEMGTSDGETVQSK